MYWEKHDFLNSKLRVKKRESIVSFWITSSIPKMKEYEKLEGYFAERKKRKLNFSAQRNTEVWE